MKKRAILPLTAVMMMLILDSQCAVRSAQDALTLCLKTLVPTLFPLFVFSAMLVPPLASCRIPRVVRFLGLPEWGEGLFLLGCVGGYPVGAACVSQAVRSGSLKREDAQRILGLVTLCGPAFLFGVIGSVLSMGQALLLFFIQLEAVMLTSHFFTAPSQTICQPTSMPPVSIHEAMDKAISTTLTVCGWVMLAGVMSGFLKRWFAPLLPGWSSVLLTGLLELTSGVFALEQVQEEGLRFILCAVMVCFGGISVHLQTAAFAGNAGLSMGQCIRQKAIQGILGAVIAAGVHSFGPAFLLLGLILAAVKIAVEISGGMVYNGPRKEGI